MATRDWMSPSWAGKAAMFANVAAKIGGYQAALALSNAQVTAVTDLCASYAAVYQHYTQSQAASAAQTDWRDLAMTGEPQGNPLPAPPAAPVWSGPGNAMIGMLKEFRDMRDQWIAAPGYTPALGEDLMIVRIASEKIAPELVQPTIKAFAAQTGYMFSIIVDGREQADAWIVQTRIMPDGGWVNLGTFTGKSADVSISPPESATPLQVQVRVQLRNNNVNYGQLSQIATVTVNP